MIWTNIACKKTNASRKQLGYKDHYGKRFSNLRLAQNTLVGPLKYNRSKKRADVCTKYKKFNIPSYGILSLKIAGPATKIQNIQSNRSRL